MKYAVIGAVSAAALLAASAAVAQAPDNKEPGTKSEKSAPMAHPGKGEAKSGQMKSDETKSGQTKSGEAKSGQMKSGEAKSETHPSGKQAAGKDKQEGPQPSKESRQPTKERAAEKGQQSKSAEKQAESKSTSGHEEKGKMSGREEQGKKRSETTQHPTKEQPKAAHGQPSTEQNKSAAGRETEQNRTKRTEGQQPNRTAGAKSESNNRVQVSEQQRTTVRERLLKEGKVSRAKINISVNVGATVPRSVHLYPLSTAIIGLAPAYRGYDYVVLEDETIVIVNPRTYVIVDVLPASSQTAQRSNGQRSNGHLTLSSEQMRFVFDHVPKTRKTDIHIQLALGAEVPRNVDLMTFPEDVVTRIPEIRDYRYVVVDDQIAIVDPKDYGVSLVINP
jgi:opacity protein-like surface antigen